MVGLSMSEQEKAMATASIQTTEPTGFAEFRRAERTLVDEQDRLTVADVVDSDDPVVVEVYEPLLRLQVVELPGDRRPWCLLRSTSQRIIPDIPLHRHALGQVGL
jgi:hypothetical protein